MTTAAELGLATPQGSDLIRNGDNAITQNANKLAELYDLFNVFAAQDLTSTSNLTTLSNGFFRVTSVVNATALNLPDKLPGILGNFKILATGASTQTYQTRGNANAVSNLYTRQLNGTTWSAWQNVGRLSPLTLTTDTVLNDLATDQYLITNRTVATTLGMPVAQPGTLWHTKVGNGWHEMFATVDNAPSETFMYQRSKTLDGVVQPWRRLATEGESAGGGDSSGPVRRDMLQQQLTARKGGTIGTGGKGVIALRFDDAPAEFVAKVLPLLRARNLPFTRVTTSQSVGAAVLPAGTFTEMQDYCIKSGGEVWNHGADHLNATGQGPIETNLIGALTALRSAMPRIPIDCFAPPGGSAINYDGHMPSNAISNWADTFTGRLLQAHHAIASGYLENSYYRPLDGVLRDGQIHYSVDAYDVTRASELVDRARDWKKGVALMWHSNNLDTEGNMTTAQLAEVLDYIVVQRDAGNILVLTKSGMGVADAGSTARDNALAKATGNPFTETLLYPQFRQNLPGSTRELTATVTGTAGATVTSVVGESSKTHTIPAGGTLQLRHVATIPLDATALTVSINANTTAAKLLAV